MLSGDTCARDAVGHLAEVRLPRLAWTTHTSDPRGAAHMREILFDADVFWDERDGADGAPTGGS